MRKSAALDEKYEAMRLHNRDQCVAMARLYSTPGASFAKVQRAFGGSIYAVRGAILRGGGVLPPNQKPALSAEEGEVIKRVLASGRLCSDAARELGRSLNTVAAYAKKHNLARAPKKGFNAPAWAGGEFLSHGYVMVWTSDAEFLIAPMRNKNGYVPKHRLVMARHLGRPLASYETVHHIDGDKQNNAVENLQLRQGRHGKGIAMQCCDCGSHNIRSVALKEPTH